MKCIACGSEELLAIVTIEKALPLAQKGGSVITAGDKITQKDIKAIWDKTHDGLDDREIRGPIICGECGAEHVYLKGVKPSLHLNPHGWAAVKNMTSEEFVEIEAEAEAEAEADPEVLTRMRRARRALV